jgi:DNA-binding NarL/FixJ family response regulator
VRNIHAWYKTAIVLSSNADQRFIEEAKKVSARAYIAKPELGEGLVKAVEAAIAGEEDFIVFE